MISRSDKLNSKERIYNYWTLVYILLGTLVLTGISFAISPLIPPGIDWNVAFRPAAQQLMHLRSPFDIPGFFNPPWTALVLIPFAVLPEQVGRVLLMLTGFIAYAYTAHKLGGSKWVIIAILVSPPVMHNMVNGNIDFLPLLGLVMPPQIGLFFVTMKPQLGVAIVLFWLIESWRVGRMRETIRVFMPITLVTLVSFLLYGLWPLRATVEVDLWWNTSLWPFSLPVGLALMIAAYRKRDMHYAMGASPCFSPYILFHSWIIAIYAMIRSTPATIAVVIGLWVLTLVRYFS